MSTVKVSENYEIVIPESIRKRLNLKPGQEIEIHESDKGFQIKAAKNIQTYRGILKGMDTNFEREPDRL